MPDFNGKWLIKYKAFRFRVRCLGLAFWELGVVRAKAKTQKQTLNPKPQTPNPKP